MTCPDRCGNCCRDMKLPLGAREAESLVSAGTELLPILPALNAIQDDVEPESWNSDNGRDWITKQILFAKLHEQVDQVAIYADALVNLERLQPGEGLFVIVGDCGNLGPNKECMDYENRPRICRDFEVGSTACQNIVFKREVPASLTAKKISA